MMIFLDSYPSPSPNIRNSHNNNDFVLRRGIHYRSCRLFRLITVSLFSLLSVVIILTPCCYVTAYTLLTSSSTRTKSTRIISHTTSRNTQLRSWHTDTSTDTIDIDADADTDTIAGHSTPTTTTTTTTNKRLQDDDNNYNNKHIDIPWLIVGGGIHAVHIAARLIGSTNSLVEGDGSSGNVNTNDIIIVDENKCLLQKWKSRTSSTGMEYLRSSAGYHLDIEEHSLRHYYHPGSNGNAAGANAVVGGNHKKSKKKKRKSNNKTNNNTNRNSHNNHIFANDYERPKLDAFNEHCDYVISKYKLNQVHVQGTVTSIELQDDSVKVVVTHPHPHPHQHTTTTTTTTTTYKAEHIILAMGNDEPSYPTDWVEDEDIQQGFVRHLLDNDNDNEYDDDANDDDVHKNNNKGNNDDVTNNTSKDVAVIGGGITAAHKVLELVKQRRTRTPSPTDDSSSNNNDTTQIHLVSRHVQFKEQQFDTHQDWMMDRKASQRSYQNGGYGLPKRQQLFQQQQPSSQSKSQLSSSSSSSNSCYKARRLIIQQERIPGTITAAIHRGVGGLKYAIQNGDVEYHSHSEVVTKRYIYDNDTDDDNDNDNEDWTRKQRRRRKRMELTLSCGTTIVVDKVLLATGFGKKLPGGKVIQKLIETSNSNDNWKNSSHSKSDLKSDDSSNENDDTNRDTDSDSDQQQSPSSLVSLPVSDYCGYPIVDTNLSWGPSGRIFVSGALAELEIGPSARNIAGARLAAERIVQAQVTAQLSTLSG